MTAPSNTSELSKPIDGEGQQTGLPGLSTWRAAYILVASICVLYIVLLAMLTRMYQ